MDEKHIASLMHQRRPHDPKWKLRIYPDEAYCSFLRTPSLTPLRPPTLEDHTFDPHAYVDMTRILTAEGVRKWHCKSTGVFLDQAPEKCAYEEDF